MVLKLSIPREKQLVRNVSSWAPDLLDLMAKGRAWKPVIKQLLQVSGQHH